MTTRPRDLPARRAATTACLAVVAAVSGCTSVAPPPGTPVLDAFHADGTGGPDETAVTGLDAARGVILRFEPGDVVELDLELTGDLAAGTARMPIVVRQPMLIHVGEHGPVGSLDSGITWSPLRSLATGALEIGLAVSSDESANSARIRLDARRR